MSAVIDLNVVMNRNIEEADAWLAKTHAANLRNIDKFRAVQKDPDTFVAGHYFDYLGKATKSVLISKEFRLRLKSEYNRIRDKDGNSYCHVFTYAHWRVQQKYGDYWAGRLTKDQDNNTEYSARGVWRQPVVRDYFQQVVREVIDRAEVLSI